MTVPLSDRVVARALLALLVFGALSAMIGAIMALMLNGAGVPLAYLGNSPFTSYAVPGLLLGVVIGGTQFAAAMALRARGRYSLLLSAIAGFGMQIWIVSELAIISHFSWLQAVYFGHGLLELLLVLALLGIAPSVVTPMRTLERN
jgi:hypothetical protein